MKIVRIEQGKRRITVRDVGDMEVQKPHGKCTSVFPKSHSEASHPELLDKEETDMAGGNSQIG